MTIDNDYYLSVSQVTARLGVSRASLYRWIAADAFPRGHHFSAGCRVPALEAVGCAGLGDDPRSALHSHVGQVPLELGPRRYGPGRLIPST